MILKDLMEEKQLNLNQPLLSVRRSASTMASGRKKKDNSLARLPPSPANKSELKSGPVRSAGTVPFVWEKAPGRPKYQTKSHTHAVEHPPITPNPPPGKVSKVKQQDFDAVSKGTSVIDMRCGSNVSNSQSIIASLDREEIKEKASSHSDDDETFVDALDTLSRTESFFMSSSVNGMSGLDDQEVQPPGSLLSSDQQARNFIIDRFLPAAKAMIAETHQYASSRKPLVGQEQQKQVKKAVKAERSLPLNQHRPKTLPHCAQDRTDNCNRAGNNTATGCGLFPRLCLLNPIPGLRMEDKAQNHAVHGMRAKSIASHSETTKEHARTPYYGKKSVDSKSGFIEEKDILCVSEQSKHGTDPHHRGCSKLLTCENTQHESSHESPVVEKTLYVDSVHKVKSHSSSCSSEIKCQTSHKGDSFETLRGGSSIYENPSSESSHGDSKRLEVVHEKATLQPISSESHDSPLLVCYENSSNDMNMSMTNHSKKIDSEKQGLTKPINQGSDLDNDMVSIPKVVDLKNQESTHGSTQDPCTMASSKAGDDGKIDLESQCLMKSGQQATPDVSCLQLALALPSLKAPSESWLTRTLPTISSKNIYSRPNLAANIHARSQTHKTSSLYPGWEPIVKSSNVHHGYQRLPEELLSTIPEA